MPVSPGMPLPPATEKWSKRTLAARPSGEWVIENVPGGQPLAANAPSSGKRTKTAAIASFMPRARPKVREIGPRRPDAAQGSGASAGPPLKMINDRRLDILAVDSRHRLRICPGADPHAGVGAQIYRGAARRPNQRIGYEVIVNRVVAVDRASEFLGEHGATGTGEEVLNIELRPAAGRQVIEAAVVDREARDT